MVTAKEPSFLPTHSGVRPRRSLAAITPSSHNSSMVQDPSMAACAAFIPSTRLSSLLIRAATSSVGLVSFMDSSEKWAIRFCNTVCVSA